MVDKEVQYIKENKKGLIETASNSTYGIHFGHGQHIKYDACFARLYKRIAEQKDGGKTKSSLQYILRYEHEKPVFAYKSLIKELNNIFGHYFKITMFLSGRKTARIIHIKEVRKLPNTSIKYVGYLMIFVLLRAIDGEFINSWRSSGKVSKKINTWFDVIYYYYKALGIGGHGINDDIMYLGKSLKLNKTKGTEKLFKVSIENFLGILTKAFGNNFNYKGVKIKPIDTDSYMSKGQTPAFRYIEEIVNQGGRK
jgi:hypothetical protein